VLVVDVLEVSRSKDQEAPDRLRKDAPAVLSNFFEAYEDITSKNLIESFHDVQAYRDQCLQLFNLGHLRLTDRVHADQIYWASCKKIASLLRSRDKIPEELENLPRLLCDTYFLNFSLFQSLPDSWAINQVFPIMPIHRHDEKPCRRGVLADITCDSDGRIDNFVDLRDVKKVLELHPLNNDEPYYLGVFLVGAYQEILGDLHNLFGDTNIAHISMDKQGGYRVEEVLQGETIDEVLQYVNYDRDRLNQRLDDKISTACAEKRLSDEDATQLKDVYNEQLSSYTYLRT
jgi:arginine decarboxylase